MPTQFSTITPNDGKGVIDEERRDVGATNKKGERK
jgi:hypothetical protein